MIIDAKVDYQRKVLMLIHDDGKIEEKQLIEPYFYVIIPKTFIDLFSKLASGLDVVISECQKTPIIYNGEKYVISNDHAVLKVAVESPTQVPKVSSQILQFNKKFDTRISAHNVRYVVRNTFDHNVTFFNSIPLYYGFDDSIIDKIAKTKALIIDVEVIDGIPRLCSCYVYKPFTPVNKDDVISLELPNQIDELAKLIREHVIIAGHNVLGFDIPVIKKVSVHIDLNRKVIFDNVYTLNTFSQSFWIGSARSLLDLAIVLKDKCGITDTEIEIKKKSRKILKSGNWNEIIQYNINDIVLTAKIMDMIYPFVATLTAFTQIPFTEVMSLPAGMIAEYFLLRFCELNGFVPEYRRTDIDLKGERVYLVSEGRIFTNVLHADIKMMYPSFVYSNLIDPTLIIGKDKYRRDVGIGLLYSAVQRLYKFREFTKALKKKDKRFEAMDMGVKAIINALAYGVQGKKSGYAPFGNPYTPASIFYGTRNVQFGLIEYLRKQGINVVYSDTDSFFVELKNVDKDHIIKVMNEYLSKYGLEADVEEIWDLMYIYGKKNYILKKGDKIITKGSAIMNLKKFYLPDCISLIELLKYEDRDERLKYIEDTIRNCELHELFIRVAQQVWRLLSKDIQSIKRSKEGIQKYLRVLTVWQEKPYIYLKKVRDYMLSMPHTAPIVKLSVEHGEVIDLHNVNAFDIIEFYMLKKDWLRLPNIQADILFWDEHVYAVTFKDMYYVLRMSGKEIEIPSNYTIIKGINFTATLTKIKLNVKIKKVNIDDQVLRNVVLEYVKNVLKEYGFL